MFEASFLAGWGDMDFNSHMRNTAFLDKSATVRMMFFAQNGYPTQEFMKRKIGPVVMKDEIKYFKEIRLLESMRVTLAIAGLSDDGSRFILRNEFWRADERMAASVSSEGGWLDLQLRKFVTPPDALLKALRSLERSQDYLALPSRIKQND